MAGRASTLFDPYQLLGVLQRQGVSFVVIGAFARVVQGTRELTDGLDITPSMREDNLSRLVRALEDLEARRVDGKPLDLRKLDGPILELETRAGKLKLVPEPAGSRGYEDLRWHAAANHSAAGSAPRSPPPAISHACSAHSTATKTPTSSSASAASSPSNAPSAISTAAARASSARTYAEPPQPPR